MSIRPNWISLKNEARCLILICIFHFFLIVIVLSWILLSWSKARVLSFFLDQYCFYFYFFLIAFLVDSMFSCLLAFYFSFINSHLSSNNLNMIDWVLTNSWNLIHYVCKNSIFIWSGFCNLLETCLDVDAERHTWQSGEAACATISSTTPASTSTSTSAQTTSVSSTVEQELMWITWWGHVNLGKVAVKQFLCDIDNLLLMTIWWIL